ncbi:MAG: hypothetical protein IPF99_25995 [Deltaproteobacteria bacterium]|nr:hypothetical protein [Deltaproteobacteria bacterium]
MDLRRVEPGQEGEVQSSSSFATSMGLARRVALSPSPSVVIQHHRREVPQQVVHPGLVVGQGCDGLREPSSRTFFTELTARFARSPSSASSPRWPSRASSSSSSGS